MASTQITLNHEELAKILKSSEVIKVMEGLADQVMDATGQAAAYERETWVGVNRARVSVKTATTKARRDEARDHTLLGALGSVQGG